MAGLARTALRSLAVFDRESAKDQIGLSEAVEYVEANIESIVEQLSPPRGGAVDAAWHEFDKAKGTGRDAARKIYFKALKQPEAAAELRMMVVAKVKMMGYDPARTVFELAQNAHDAYVQKSSTTRRDLVVTLDEDWLDLRHWGRPVNGLEGDEDHAKQEKWHRDLINMLSLNQTAKHGEVVGTFGLGFKCVHMLTETPYIASDRLHTRIIGGILPDPWKGGFEALDARSKPGQPGTLIRLPLTSPIARKDAKAAVDAFAANVEGLIISRANASMMCRVRPMGTIRRWRCIDDVRIETDGTIRSWRCVETGLTDTITHLKLETPDGKKEVLRFDLGGGYSLAVPLEDGLPVKTEKTPDFWRLAPLGISNTAAWMMDGPFSVDPGRQNFQGDNAAQREQAGGRAQAITDSLAALFANGVESISQDEEGFWDRTV